jgi:hypothetical protein
MLVALSLPIRLQVAPCSGKVAYGLFAVPFPRGALQRFTTASRSGLFPLVAQVDFLHSFWENNINLDQETESSRTEHYTLPVHRVAGLAGCPEWTASPFTERLVRTRATGVAKQEVARRQRSSQNTVPCAAGLAWRVSLRSASLFTECLCAASYRGNKTRWGSRRTNVPPGPKQRGSFGSVDCGCVLVTPQ